VPDFTITIAGGSWVPWTDPASAGPIAPSRLNDDPAHLRTYLKVLAPSTITITAVVEGVSGPLDSDPVMAGRLFSTDFAEWSGNTQPALASAPGHSSVVTVTLLSQHIGHHIAFMSLAGLVAGQPTSFGGLGIPFDVE
jgi:hypothetical protein